jgi:hypothetical protein
VSSGRLRPSPSSGNASVVVREPTGVQVLPLPSPMSETRSSSDQVVLPRCITYVLWHGNVTKPFKARPPELAALYLSLTVPSHRQARRAGKKFLRRCLHRRWSCSRVSCTVALLLLLLPVNASPCCMASSGLPGARQVAMINAESFHLWSCGWGRLGVGVLDGMGCLLAGFQDRRRGTSPPHALACLSRPSPSRTGAAICWPPPML